MKKTTIDKIDWETTAKLLKEVEKMIEEMEKNENIREI